MHEHFSWPISALFATGQTSVRTPGLNGTQAPLLQEMSASAQTLLKELSNMGLLSKVGPSVADPVQS